MDDVRAVMDAAGSERAALFGLSEGGPMSVAVRRHLSRAHAAPWCCTARFAADARRADYPWAPTRGAASSALAQIERALGRGRASLGRVAPSAATTPSSRWLGARFERSAASPAMARTLIE